MKALQGKTLTLVSVHKPGIENAAGIACENCRRAIANFAVVSDGQTQFRIGLDCAKALLKSKDEQTTIQSFLKADKALKFEVKYAIVNCGKILVHSESSQGKMTVAEYQASGLKNRVVDYAIAEDEAYNCKTVEQLETLFTKHGFEHKRERHLVNGLSAGWKVYLPEVRKYFPAHRGLPVS